MVKIYVTSYLKLSIYVCLLIARLVLYSVKVEESFTGAPAKVSQEGEGGLTSVRD